MSKLDDVFQNPSKYLTDNGSPNDFFYINKSAIISELGILTGKELECSLDKLYQLNFHKMRFTSRDKKKLVSLGQENLISITGSKRYGDEAIEFFRNFNENPDMFEFINELKVFLEEKKDIIRLLELTRPNNQNMISNNCLFEEDPIPQELCFLTPKDLLESIECEYKRTIGKNRPSSLTQWYYEWFKDNKDKIITTQQESLYISEEDLTLLLRFFGKLFNRVSKCAGTSAVNESGGTSRSDGDGKQEYTIKAGTTTSDVGGSEKKPCFTHRSDEYGEQNILINEIVRMQNNIPLQYTLMDSMNAEDMLLIESAPEIREDAYKNKLLQILFNELDKE